MWTPEKGVAMGAFRQRQQQTRLVYDYIPPDPADAPSRRVHIFKHKPDIQDADFVILPAGRGSAAAARGGAQRHTPEKVHWSATLGGWLLVALLALVRIAESLLQRASPRGFAVFVVALATLVFGLVGGFSGLSGGGGAALADPLQFTHVTLTPRDANGMRILLLNGIVENAGDRSLPMKPIRADLVADGKLSTSIVIAPPVERVAAGESRGFTARLQYAGGKLPEARLSFMP